MKSVHPATTPSSVNTISAEISSFCAYDFKETDRRVDPHRRLDVHTPCRNKFPSHLRSFVKFMIPGNDICPDCSLRSSSSAASNDRQDVSSASKDLVWANIDYGTIICEDCAFLHIRMNDKTSSILSLDSSYWELQQILSILEGGNAKFCKAMEKKGRDSLARTVSFKSKSIRALSHNNNINTQQGISSNYNKGNDPWEEFQSQYQKPSMESYRLKLLQQVEVVGMKHGVDSSSRKLRCEQKKASRSDGISLATFLVNSQRKHLLKDYLFDSSIDERKLPQEVLSRMHSVQSNSIHDFSELKSGPLPTDDRRKARVAFMNQVSRADESLLKSGPLPTDDRRKARVTFTNQISRANETSIKKKRNQTGKELLRGEESFFGRSMPKWMKVPDTKNTKPRTRVNTPAADVEGNTFFAKDLSLKSFRVNELKWNYGSGKNTSTSRRNRPNNLNKPLVLNKTKSNYSIAFDSVNDHNGVSFPPADRYNRRSGPYGDAKASN